MRPLSKMSSQDLQDFNFPLHLPDTSETSFQIPAAGDTSNDFLLADNHDDFLRAADDSLMTPPRPQSKHEPLTLSQVTPLPPRCEAPEPPELSNHSATRPTHQDDPLTLSELTPQPRHDVTSTLQAVPPLSKAALAHRPELKPNAKPTQDPKARRAVNPTVQTLRRKFQEPSERNVDRKPKLKPKLVGPPPVPEKQETSNSGPERFKSLKKRMETMAGDAELPAMPGPSTERFPVRPILEPRRDAKPNLRLRTKPPSDRPAAAATSAVADAKLKLRVREKPRVPLKPTVASGGISKPNKKKLPTSTLTKAALKKRHPAVEAGISDEQANMSVSSNGGVAERLVMYGQKLMNSFGLFNTEQTSNVDREQIQGRDGSNVLLSSPAPIEDRCLSSSEPLTLSQITPRKEIVSIVSEASEVADPPFAPSPSPMRTSSKRPLSATPEASIGHRKRGKTAVVAEADAVESTTHRLIATQNAVLQNSAQRNVAVAMSKKPMFHGKTGSVSRQAKGKDKEDVVASSSTNSTARSNVGAGRRPYHQGALRNGQTLNSDKSANATKPTRPQGFDFQLDQRMETRKVDFEGKQASLRRRPNARPLNRPPVPDFKALHAVQEASLTSRKEHIKPVLPVAVEFSTDTRAKEREKFDQMMRQKEIEIERQKQEKRRLREMEEEKEIQELRKKAVPKAHQVPEWYADMRKKRSDYIQG